ncbi:MAG: aldehyde dehydrogenase family protein, partial [Planctomycetes bacterium]|nr:aldehyde dehydrogenase family protein [Planctomycetota bacterium]
LDLAVDGILWSAFWTTGQRSTAASRLVVHREVEGALVERLVARARAMRLGDGLDEATDVGPVVNRSQLENVDRYVQIGKQEGARLLCGGEIARDGALAKGFFYRPTIFGGCKPSMRIAQEEIFGPVLSVLPVGSFEEAIDVANGTAYGLSASLYTRDVNRAFSAMRDLENGLVYVNAGTIGSEVSTPFGGMKATGNGHREAGRQALDTFSEWKSCFIDYSGKLQRAQIDTKNGD